MRPKQIIIDKDMFRGINLNALCDFTWNHFLILPDVLYYECVTADEIRKCDSSKACRLECLVKRVEFIDSQDIQNASKEILKGITKFPEKDVFSDLDEVSEEYLCNFS